MKAKAKYGPEIYEPGNKFNRDSNGNWIHFDGEKAMREYWKRKLEVCNALTPNPTVRLHNSFIGRQWNSYDGRTADNQSWQVQSWRKFGESLAKQSPRNPLASLPHFGRVSTGVALKLADFQRCNLEVG